MYIRGPEGPRQLKALGRLVFPKSPSLMSLVAPTLRGWLEPKWNEGHSLNEWPEGSQDHTPRLVPEGYLGTLITQDQRLEGVWPT